MNLQDFEKLANGLGLVPMLILSDLFTPYRPKDIAGFFPDTALDLFQKEVAVPVGADGKALEVKSSAPTAPPENAGADPGTIVEIPVGWAELHHLKRVKLARDLTGRTDIAKADEADAVIAAEVERRALAASPENAGA